MTWEIAAVGLILLLVFIAFVREISSPDVIAMAAMGALLAIGILSVDDALGVFSNSAPITILCMFILSAALERTGCLDVLGFWMERLAGQSYIWALFVIMIMVLPISALMNNTPIVVVLTPIVVALARKQGQASSKFLIPLSFAAILGGTTTMIGTSTNLLVAGVAVDQGLPAFGIFDITLPGLVLAATGMVYMMVIGRFLLPDRTTIAGMLASRPKRSFIAEIFIPADSPLIGKALADTDLTGEDRVILDVLRYNVSLRYRLKSVELKAGDIIVLESNTGEMLALKESGEVEFKPLEPESYQPLQAEETVVMEGIVGPQSRLVGLQVANLRLRRLYDVYVLAVHRQNEAHSRDFENMRLGFGDTLLIEGPAEGIGRLFESGDLINLTEPLHRAVRRHKAPFALATILGVMMLAALNVMPIAGLALIGAFAVVLLGCLDPDEVYKRVDWQVIFLIFGMLGVSVALEKTGAAALLAGGTVSLAAGWGPLAILAALYFLTSLMTETVSNNAVAVLLAPIAISIAEQLGLSPLPFLVAIMFAASASFATPIGYQTNTFIYNAGGYKFTDFLKVGLPLNIILWGVSVAVIPVFFPFNP